MKLPGRNNEQSHTNCLLYLMKLPGRQKGSITHSLLVIEWDVTRLADRECRLYCSHPVGHVIRSVEVAWEKTWQWHSHPVGMRYDEIICQKKGWVTDLLLAMELDVSRPPTQDKQHHSQTVHHVMSFHGLTCIRKRQCHSQPVCHGAWSCQAPWQKKIAVSLTSCWDEMSWDFLAEK